MNERFWARVDVGHPLGCWLWTGRVDPQGYGRFDAIPEAGGRSRPLLAHRVAYRLLTGEEPGTLDHLCRTPPCVNPDHLEGVGRGENVRRALQGRRQTPGQVARRMQGWTLKGHGTRACYQRGCRCASCLAAGRAHNRAMRDRRRELSPEGVAASLPSPVL